MNMPPYSKAMLVAVWIGSAAIAAAQPSAETIAYTARPADNLYTLATRYLQPGFDYRKLQRFNKMADAKRLRIGQKLLVPMAWLKIEPLSASVEAFSGAVTLGGTPVRVGSRLAAGAELATGANSFVSIRFADETLMTLPSASRVQISGLGRILLTGAVDRRILVQSGRSRYSVTPRTNPSDRFEVRTPLAVAAVRGTEFRVSYDPPKMRSALEVLEGEVAESTVTGDTLVNAVATGSASLHMANVPLAQQLSLPAVPVMIRPGRLQDDPQVGFEFAMPGQHRVQLARDAGFVDIFSEMETDGAAQFSDVPNGTMFVRGTALDSNGIEGRAVVYAFERQLNSVDSTTALQPGHRYNFKWTGSGDGIRIFRFILAHDAALTDRIVDAPGLTGNAILVSDLGPGQYFWRLEVEQFVGGKVFAKAFRVNALNIDPEQ